LEEIVSWRELAQPEATGVVGSPSVAECQVHRPNVMFLSLFIREQGGWWFRRGWKCDSTQSEVPSDRSWECRDRAALVVTFIDALVAGLGIEDHATDAGSHLGLATHGESVN
jgi:hypothetical protein